jgi:hypothetical protein
VSPEEFAAFVRAAPWTFAKTMPETPHEYTLRKQHDEHQFERAVQFVRDHGFRHRWHRATYTYLAVDGKKYWTMGWPVAETIVLNRADLQEGDAERQLQADAARREQGPRRRG